MQAPCLAQCEPHAGKATGDVPTRPAMSREMPDKEFRDQYARARRVQPRELTDSSATAPLRLSETRNAEALPDRYETVSVTQSKPSRNPMGLEEAAEAHHRVWNRDKKPRRSKNLAFESSGLD